MNETNKIVVFFIGLALFLAVLSGCSTEKVGIANPASTNCIDNGGKLELRDQTGYCKLSNGKECEEWAYFRGECTATYDVEKVLESTCSKDQDCVTPGEYQMISRCPMTTKCLSDKCTVVCPYFNGNKYEDVKECGTCPMLSAPAPGFCKDGKIVAGEKDSCGCIGAPRCEPVACTMDAKVCPDGSAVGRVGPDCEFEACPNEFRRYVADNVTVCAATTFICETGTKMFFDETGCGCEAENPIRYISKDKSVCETVRIGCENNTVPFNDETGCGCKFSWEPKPSGKKAPIYCTPEQKNAEICTMEYHAVCGWFNQSVKCLAYPCAIDAGNPCQACANPSVEYYTEGECPKVGSEVKY